MGKQSSFFLGLLIFSGLIIHIIPFLTTGEPFSTDVWPLIRASEKIVADPGIRIWDDGKFDGYNNRWPGVILSSSLVSQLTGLSPRIIYSFLLLSISLLASSLTLYSFARRVVRNDVPALVLPLTLLFYPSTSVFTSSLLKEVYAYPFAFALLLIASRDIYHYLPLASIFIASMVLSHHLASIMISSMLIAIATTCTALRYIGFYRGSCPMEPRRCIVLGLITGGVFLTYYSIYGGRNMVMPGYSDIVILIIYACFITMGTIAYLRFSRIGYIEGFVIMASILLLTMPRTPLLIGLSIDYGELLPYVIPALTPYILLIDRRPIPRDLIAMVYAFIIPPTTFSLYSIIAKPEFSSIVHRFMNYYFLPAGLLLGSLSIYGRRLLRIFTIIVLSSLIISSSILIALSSHGYGPIFYWRYSEAEVRGLEELSRILSSDSVCGDAKVYYFYIGVKRVDMGSILAYSYSNRLSSLTAPAIVLKHYFSRGYVVSISIYRIDSFLSSIHMFNRLFDSGGIIVVR